MRYELTSNRNTGKNNTGTTSTFITFLLDPVYFPATATATANNTHSSKASSEAKSKMPTTDTDSPEVCYGHSWKARSLILDSNDHDPPVTKIK